MNRILLFSLLLVIVSSCSEPEKKQFKYAGGKITMALDNEPSTYIPRKVMDYYSATVLSQITEGLVGMDSKTTKIVPRLAKSWTKSDDGKEYVFTLRENVMFHPHKAFKSDEDRLLTAKDVIKSFELGCSEDEKGMEQATYSMICKSVVVGADNYFHKKSKKISGITAKGNKVTFKLIHSDHNFLYKLANVNAAIVSKRVVESGNETDVIGTGPFVYSKYKGGDQASLILTKNHDYYLNDADGNALPYLDSLVFIFQSRKLEQLDLFENGIIDLILGLPTSRITRMLEGRIEDFNSKPPKLVLANNPLLETNYYFFNLKDKRFQDVKVRKAFNYAVDKQLIGREILRNQYYDIGDYGMTPPISKAIKGYDFKSIKEAGYSFDPEQARQLLAEAGYPNGEGFGSVELRYNINDTHSAVADEFAKQIAKVLNINVNIDGSSFEQLITDGESGNGDIFRLGWSADYPSPESFLVNFYGANVPEDPNEPSRVNKSRYKNPVFDEFFDRAIGTKKISDQLKFFAKAELALLQDPPFIPLWYTGDIGITNSYIRNLHFNALNYMDFTYVYIKKWTESEYQKEVSSKK
ncbi:MAG: peptide ABC transporter substrate-binding protein [Crocinitomicaceae bacterium]|nr:peptide ABC transporter substrate-binding protein [Crocinitomicaceae bacterium]